MPATSHHKTENEAAHAAHASAGASRPFVPLLYHELRPQAASYSYVLPCDRFAQHLQLFARLRQDAAGSDLPLLTFDDGHLSDHTYALPLLQQYGQTAHFFITAGWTGSRSHYMEPHHLRDLHTAGHTIGAHGWSHTLLTQCDDAALQQELGDARAALQDHIGAPVTSLSLPGGRSNARVLRAARDAGYTTIWTSVPGETVSATEPLIGRFNILAGATDTFLTGLLDPATGVLRRAARASRMKSLAKGVLGDRLYAALWAAVNRQEAETTEGAIR